MSEYCSSVEMLWNGRKIKDIKSVTENSVPLAEAVELMDTTGSIDKTPRYGLKVVYVIPKFGRIDWSKVRNATINIIDDGGVTVSYIGCRPKELGERKFDGNSSVDVTIDLIAEKRIES